MRRLADAPRIRAFLERLGAAAEVESAVYLVGGSTAVLQGWRPSTIDVDLKVVPESSSLLRAIPRLKEELELNVELASPEQFVPELPGWRDRSPFVARHGRVTFYHYDFYAQALAKLERGHRQDLDDAEAMAREGLVAPRRLLELFEAIAPELYRYPAVDPAAFRRAVESFVAGRAG